MASFFYCGRLSSAQLVPLQAPKHRPIIGPHPVEQTAFRRDIKENGYKYVFTNLWAGTSTEQVADKNPQKEWTHSLTAVPFVRGHEKACSLGTPRIPQMSQPRVACWHGYRQNSQKMECVLRRPPIRRFENKIASLKRPSEADRLTSK